MNRLQKLQQINDYKLQLEASKNKHIFNAIIWFVLGLFLTFVLSFIFLTMLIISLLSLIRVFQLSSQIEYVEYEKAKEYRRVSRVK